MSVRAPCALAMLVCAACSGRVETAQQPVPDLSGRGAVVARVGDLSIGADDVAAAARDLRLGPRDALQRLIDQRLLVLEGRRMGTITPDDLRQYQWHATVQLLLEREVETGRDEASIPAAEVAASMRERAMELSPDLSIDVAHFLAQYPEHPTDADRAAAMAKAVAFRDRVTATSGERPTLAQFDAIVVERPIEGTRAERIGPFDREGRLTQGALVPEFTRGAWALTAEAPLSQPVISPFGVHVILLVREHLPRPRPASEVEAIVRHDLSVSMRSHAGSELFNHVRATRRVVINREALREVESMRRESRP